MGNGTRTVPATSIVDERINRRSAGGRGRFYRRKRHGAEIFLRSKGVAEPVAGRADDKPRALNVAPPKRAGALGKDPFPPAPWREGDRSRTGGCRHANKRCTDFSRPARLTARPRPWPGLLGNSDNRFFRQYDPNGPDPDRSDNRGQELPLRGLTLCVGGPCLLSRSPPN